MKATLWEMIAGDALRKRLIRLILIRLMAVLLLIFSLFTMDQVMPHRENRLSQLSAIIFLTCGLTLVYALMIRFWKAYFVQAYIQVAGDILLVTSLVAQTKIIESPFTALFLLVIFMASSLVSRAGTFILTALACGCYGITAYAAYQHWWPFVGYRSVGEISVHTLGSAISFNFFAFLAVAFLGSQLHQRLSQTDEHLAQTTRRLSDLRAFSERVIASISSGLVTVDLRYHIISFNRAAEEITGYAAREVLGEHLNVLIPDSRSFLDASLEASLSGQHLSRLNGKCQTKSGDEIQLGLSISPLTTTSGEITGFVVPFQDLTEVLQLEREVRRQDRLAALGRVAAAIAHEIRNPLASMRGAVQMLGSDMALTDEQTQLMNIVLRESDRLDRIITDFLMYARPRQPELAVVDLNEILEETATLLRLGAGVSPDRYEIVTHPWTESALVEADSGQLRQVFWNLSRNAIKAMPDGGRLIITVTRIAPNSEAPSGLIEVSFSDTGIGMTEEQIERVFEPFSSFSSGGTGLGMSIVYQIVQEHHGRIFINSQPGKGTSINIRLAALAQVTVAQAAA
jgi:two-component system sensor histidine kinase PilS (NtrC family)